jgi:hypothetical protein
VNALTVLTAAVAAVAIGARSDAVGLAGRPWTAVFSESTDDFIALVWLGKSLLAELTSFLASFSRIVTCARNPLAPPVLTELGRPLTAFSRLLRSEQYAGLPDPPQPVATTNATTVNSVSNPLIATRRTRHPDETLMMESAAVSGTSNPPGEDAG